MSRLPTYMLLDGGRDVVRYHKKVRDSDTHVEVLLLESGGGVQRVERSRLKALTAPAEVHLDCGGFVKLVHETFKCLKCGAICPLSETRTVTP